MCFIPRDASIDTQHGLHFISHDLDLRSNFGLDHLRSSCMYFDVSRRGEDIDARIMSLALLVIFFSIKRF